MFVDAATLHDLDVLSSSTSGGLTLLGAVDRTRTRAGSQELRKRLGAPATGSDRILALQGAHRHLAAESTRYRANFERAGVDAVDRYLDSGWQPAAARRWIVRIIEGVWLRIPYREYCRLVEDGQARVGVLLAAAAELCQRLTSSDQSALREIAAAMQVLLDSPDGREVARRCGGSSMVARLGFDHHARGSGKTCLRGIITLFGTLEAMWSLGVATAEHGWAYPTLGARFGVDGLYHPLLKGRPVANDLRLDGLVRVCFLTGPNMAGKSTFLRAIALAVILAHLGCGVPAASMEFDPVQAVFSSVQIQDNLNGGESFYLAEVRRIKSLAMTLRNSGATLAVLDEPFRGTNVHDAEEATMAVIARLAAHRVGLVFIASHLGGLVAQISADPRVRLLHFAADLGDGPPRFDFRLRDGGSTQRLGMTLLKQEGVLDLLTAPEV